MGLVAILITILIVLAICYACFWLIDSSFPAPLHMIAKLVVGVVGLFFLLQKTGLLNGVAL